LSGVCEGFLKIKFDRVFLSQQNIKDYFRKHGTFTELMWSTAVAIFAVGGMFGSVIGQIIANFLGR